VRIVRPSRTLIDNTLDLIEWDTRKHDFYAEKRQGKISHRVLFGLIVFCMLLSGILGYVLHG
jgi:hypothetical protein